jgi:hypothetical protein
MGLEISGYDPAKVSQIQNAANGEWDFNGGWECGDEKMEASGQESLYAGESEEEFVERLSVAIWTANGSYCEVVVDATYLENVPCETHCLNETDYARLMPGKDCGLAKE